MIPLSYKITKSSELSLPSKAYNPTLTMFKICTMGTSTMIAIKNLAWGGGLFPPSSSKKQHSQYSSFDSSPHTSEHHARLENEPTRYQQDLKYLQWDPKSTCDKRYQRNLPKWRLRDIDDDRQSLSQSSSSHLLNSQYRNSHVAEAIAIIPPSSCQIKFPIARFVRLLLFLDERRWKWYERG